MADNAFGDFFLSDVDDELLEDDEDLITPPVVVPAQGSVMPVAAPIPVVPAPVETPIEPVPQPVITAPDHGASASAQQAASAPTPRPAAQASQPTREERLAASLNQLMQDNQEIQASALVSLDGFTMASALPEGMQEDRVGAMSAAILGLGERAAAELGRGQLSQVFIEGEDGYVVLMAAGQRAVLTCLADREAKLGLVLFDMRASTAEIAQILG